MGTEKFSVYLTIEAPLILPIRIDTFIDHTFLVPGVVTVLKYDSFISPHHLNFNPIHERIEKYYVAKYEMLGVKKVVQEAYQFTRDYQDLQKAVAILDSMCQNQHRLLQQKSIDLPTWFMEYEIKNIDHTTLAYKLAVGSNLVYRNAIEPNDVFLRKLASNFSQSSEENIIIPFYLTNLESIAAIQHCPAECHEEPAYKARLYRYLALISLLEELGSKNIRGCLAYRQLMSISRSAQDVPDSITTKLKDFLNSSSLNNRYQKYIYRDLTGEKAPNFYLRDLDTTFHTLLQYRGKMVLLKFWFVGCKPCLEEVPHEKRIASGFEDDELSFINVCVKSTSSAWMTKVHSENLPGINLYANENWSNKMIKNYNITSYPRYVLLNGDGMVVKGVTPRPSNPRLELIIRDQLKTNLK